MKLTWKDGLTTALMGLATAVMLAVTQGWDWPLLGSYRTGTLALGLLGIGMCAVGSREVVPTETNRGYVVTMSTLGGAAGVLILVGLISGWRLAFLTLYALTMLLWVVATIRHAARPVAVVMVPKAVRNERKEPSLTSS